jgi:membrane associated rhomboid family serine protease
LPKAEQAPISGLTCPERPFVNSPREPIFNIPAIVVVLMALIGLVHAVFVLVLTPSQATDFLITFSFIPARYDLSLLADESWIRGWGAAVWSFVTYAFIHGDLSHLFFNLIWLLAFGTPVARRFGPFRFTIFFLVTAAAGAAAHLATHFGEMLPMVGASAAISGAMAAALRFVFQRGGPLGLLRSVDDAAYRVPAVPLGAMLRNPRALAFIAVWFGINALFGAGGIAIPGMEQSVAWEAHVGGFLAGLLAFAAFDSVREPPPALSESAPDDTSAPTSDGPPPIAH